MKIIIPLAACFTGALVSSSCVEKVQKQPNILYILADDLGYGDLSCYGQQKFSTQNIDRLAKEGMLFTRHYTGCTVSAPSRSSLMTGQHTGHTPIRGNKDWTPEGNSRIDLLVAYGRFFLFGTQPQMPTLISD